MELIQQKLERLERELEDLKKEYQEYAYIISHDLNAPLRSIEGFAAIISEDNANKFDDKTKKNFEYIVKSSENLKKIISALLDYSRINTMNNVFSQVNCNDLLCEVKDQLKEIIEQTESIILIENLPIIQGDREQLIKVFYHLLKNALLYRKEGVRPKIVIACKDKVNIWEFSIKDNGIGIKDNLKEKIFKVLRRAVSNKKYQGIGMGLNIAQKILNKHHGNIWLESESDSGSTFFFTVKKYLGAVLDN
ncbi:MAG: ATP-binding protein [Rickettsiales bacterium]|jgi:light-regulated signal transduction histidine kinase (bacteriophytochrome)|nr:ATP-binding protein [Rickettsiales bacterium]